MRPAAPERTRPERALLAALVFVVGAAADRDPRQLRRPASPPRLRGGEVFTDDHAPVEWLVDGSLLEYASE